MLKPNSCRLSKIDLPYRGNDDVAHHVFQSLPGFQQKRCMPAALRMGVTGMVIRGMR